jgi:hypothetical protein
MDIMMPDIHEQPAPAPWLALREHVDARKVVHEVLARNAKATPEDVAHELRKRNAELPADVVADLMQRARPAVADGSTRLR